MGFMATDLREDAYADIIRGLFYSDRIRSILVQGQTVIIGQGAQDVWMRCSMTARLFSHPTNLHRLLVETGLV